MKLSKTIMNYVITLQRGNKDGLGTFGGKERHTVTIDHKGQGVNGDYTRNKVMPVILKKIGYENATFKLEGFRYYLGTCVYQLTLYIDGQEVRGHIVSNWLDNEALTID